MQAIEIYADSARGIYIPQHFAESHGENWTGFDNEDIAVLMDGPENEEYWDTWGHVLDNAEVTFRGYTWTLYQDGDLFCVCPELMSPSELENYHEI